ncbi:hypothetical protein [Clostridium paridis]|nr:hypothetical protein [Clostridium paridis]
MDCFPPCKYNLSKWLVIACKWYDFYTDIAQIVLLLDYDVKL